MKRDALKELGLTAEQIDAVMKANGQDIQGYQDKLDGVEALTTERDSLKEQLAGRDKDLKGLQKQLKDSDDLKNQVSEWQDKYSKDTKALNDQLANQKLNSSLDNALNAAKVRDVKAIKPYLDMDSIKLDDDGKLTGLDEQVKAIHDKNGWLFDEGTKSNYNPGGNDGDVTPNAEQQLLDTWGIKDDK